MTPSKPLKDLDALIRDLERTAETIEQESADFPAVHRNIRRIQASIKMLRLNVSDLLEI
jgi:hypothetical protein